MVKSASEIHFYTDDMMKCTMDADLAVQQPPEMFLMALVNSSKIWNLWKGNHVAK